ncbi:MAG TPA: hypothetical protein VJ886_07135 [Roseovarius sp.]|nr:hypothetical protein [Roseovarius sp.]
MFRKILVLAFGMALGAGGAQAASPLPALPGPPALGAAATLVGHRHARGHDRHGYHRGYRPARPRYRDRDHYRPRHGYQHGYYRGYRGRYPAYGQGNAFPHGHQQGVWQDYLRNRYGK